MTVEHIITLLEEGQLDQAKEGFQAIIEAGSDDERFLLAEELYRLGFLEETKKLLEVLLQNYPDEGELLIFLAETCLELDDEERALLLLENIGFDDPEYPRGLLLMADLYQMDGLLEVSEEKLLEAKRLLPDEPVIDFALGELYLHQGRFSDAIEAYEKALRERSEIGGTSLYQRLAEAYSAGGSFEQALEFYEKALEEKLEINTLFGYALTALQAGNDKLAIEKLEEVKALDPEYHSLYLQLAKAYERDSRLDEAFDNVLEGIRQDEYNKDLYFYGGRLALKLAKEEEAERLLREALALDPGFMEAALVLNKLFIRQERYKEVLDLIRDTDIKEDEEPQLLWDAALSSQHLEEYSEALNKYRLAYTFFKDNQDFLEDFGYFLIEEGKMAEADEIFNKLKKIDPVNTEYLDVLERLNAE